MRSSFQNILPADHDRLSDMPERLAREIPAISALLRSSGATRVLQVGSATGAHARALGVEGFEVTGIDPNLLLVAYARSRPDAPAGVRFEQATFEEWLRGAKPPVDAVLCLDNTLPHLVEQRSLGEVVKQLAQALRPGGMLIVHTANARHLEEVGVVAAPLRSWEDGERQVTMMNQCIDGGDTLQQVITRVEIAKGRGVGSSWDQHLPKIHVHALQQALLLTGWQETRIAGGWEGEAFDEVRSPAIRLTSRKQS